MATSAGESQDSQEYFSESLLDSQQLRDEEELEEQEGGGDGVGAQEKREGEAGKKSKAKGKKEKKPKAVEPICTERDPLERKELVPASFTVLSWNVNGLRATVKNGVDVLRRVVKAERPDLICFQETKLQEKDVGPMQEQDILPGYSSAWSCSTVKKGYAGTAVFFTNQAEPWTGGGGTADGPASQPAKKKQKQGKISNFFSPKETKEAKPKRRGTADTAEDSEDAAGAPPDESAAAAAAAASAALPGGRSGLKVLGMRFGIGNSKHDGEGRSITVEYEKFFVVTLYVPNSGQKLERLSYRTKEWDVALRAYVEALEAEGKPVVVNGDLNVAHLDLDIYNSSAKHLVKGAGTTKEERESFDSWMKGGKVVDAFRRLHPDAKGAYTYWSVRTNARPVNKGLRLDYFVCSSSLFGNACGGSKAAGKGKGGKRKGAKKAAASAAVAVHDCFLLDAATVGLSDHCPVGLVLRLPA